LNQVLQRICERFAQKWAGSERRGIGGCGMRSALADELFTAVRVLKTGDCKLIDLARPAGLEPATSWFVG
jgi:hypothetical protein